MDLLPRIQSIEHFRPGWSRVVFLSGQVIEIEWVRFAKAGTVFEKLADPEYAAQAQVLDYGHGLEWPDGMDWSAGAVLQEGTPVQGAAQQIKRPA